ncbi:MAG: segregation/condensation protein A [Phycisphaerae bacterium]|nr:segregation/condensation protein A [Phycisphaerae bacterium]
MSEYRVNLDVFAGPLDLLLYLVRKEEVDIYDIPIARVTAQYIEYIELLKGLDIDLAGDFLVMAATLMEIKSAMLLPSADAGQTEEGQIEDPRAELVRQLLEYKRFKDAANLLGDSAQVRQQRYTRPATILERLKPTQEPEVDLDQVSIWTLLEAFDGIMKATGQHAGYGHIKDDTPIDLYQIEVLHRLQVEGGMTLERIFEGRKDRLGMIGLFMGILELIRNRLIWAEQPEANGPILLKALTNEPAEEAVQKAIYADHPEEDGEDDAAVEAQEMQTLEEETYALSPDDDEDDLDDDMRRELSEIKEVEIIDTGGSADTRPLSVEAGNSAVEKADGHKPDKPRIPIVDIGPASADDAARSKIETVKENEI